MYLWLLLPTALIAAVLLFSYYAYRQAFASPLGNQNDFYNLPDDEQYNVFREQNIAAISRLAARPYEEVSILSPDGLRLFGRLYETNAEAPLALCFHGWRGTSIRDFCGVAPCLLEMGYNVLLVDERSCGKSEGRQLCFGLRERYDCQAWARAMDARYGGRRDLFLCGVSMGATTVLMAAGLPLPPSVRGVIADSPFSSPRAILRKVCRDRGLPPALGYPFLALGARLFGGLDPDETSAAKEIAATKIPVLIIHGTEDRFVPCQMSEEIAAASPLARRETFPAAGHGLSFLVDQPRYRALISDFLQKQQRKSL